MKTQDTIPIVLATNDYFVPYMSVAIQSVLKNADQKNKYFFYILHSNISTKNKENLNDMVENHRNFFIDFIDVNLYIKDYAFFVGTHHTGITIETWFRLFIPEILSQFGYKKAVYLDGDMICLTDIAELFKTNIEEYCLAASPDIMGIGGYYSRTHNNRLYKQNYSTNSNFNDGKLIVKNIDKYFNAGTLLFNIHNIKQNITTSSILEFAVSKNWKCHDQDVLNILFEEKTLLLPMHWNYTEEENIERFAPAYLQEDYYAAKDNTKIIHFCKNKPWKLFYYAANFQYFWYYALQTPFYSTIIQRMRTDGLITSTTCDQQLIDAAKNGTGPGLRALCKSALLYFLNSKLNLKFK